MCQQEPGHQCGPGDGNTEPSEVAGEGDDEDVDRQDLADGDDTALVSQAIGVVVELDRRPVMRGIGHFGRRQLAARPLLAHPARSKPGDQCRSACRGRYEPRRERQTEQLRRSIRKLVWRGVAGGHTGGREACEVNSKRDCGVLWYVGGSLREHLHEHVAPAEYGADLIATGAAVPEHHDIGHV